MSDRISDKMAEHLHGLDAEVGHESSRPAYDMKHDAKLTMLDMIHVGRRAIILPNVDVVVAKKLSEG